MTGLTNEFTIVAGLVLGLLSTLHCGAMCGGICSRALMLLSPTPGQGELVTLSGLQAGRISIYAAIGAVAGSIGAAIIPDGTPTAFVVLRWGAALSLVWVGFVVLGMVPALGPVDRLMHRASRALTDVLRPLAGMPLIGSFVVGLGWGLSACPAVYGAALAASVSGSSLHGALFMIAFGVGTIPGVAGGGFVLAAVTRAGQTPHAVLRTGVGASLIGVGFLSIQLPMPTLLAICSLK